MTGPTNKAKAITFIENGDDVKYDLSQAGTRADWAAAVQFLNSELQVAPPLKNKEAPGLLRRKDMKPGFLLLGNKK